MQAMVLQKAGEALQEMDVPQPRPGNGQVLIKVHACGVCRTDLHIMDRELLHPNLPLVMGHQIVGAVVDVGAGIERFTVGDRVGVPWLGFTDGTCRYCREGHENLCENARFTGYDIDGGYANFTVADARYCFLLPDDYPDVQVAPLLCAGLIGYRALSMTGEAQRLGLYGFGSSAHIIAQVARHQGRQVFAFTRDGDQVGQQFAKAVGVDWVGGSGQSPPEELDAAIIFAAVGELVPTALRMLARGGTVVCAGIHMSDIPTFSYDDLWQERSIRSVANLTRKDGEEFLALAQQIPIQTTVESHPLTDVNVALDRLRHGMFQGSAVVVNK